MLKKTMFLFAVVVAAGCGGDKIEKGLKEWKDKMCECKDLACADKVHEEYKKWEKDVLEPAFKDKKKEDVSESLLKLDQERKDCRRKLRDSAGSAAGAGGAAPTPTEGSAAPTP